MNEGNTSQEIPGQARNEANPLIAGLTRDLQALRAGLVLTNNILQKIDEIG